MSDSRHRRSKTVHTLRQFVALIEKVPGTKTVLYRGQRKEYPLVPSLARQKFTDELPIQEIEANLLTEFQRHSTPYARVAPKTIWEWLALAQHHGLPTRLLDWTVNPLMALWFAVKEPPEGRKRGVVYMLTTDENDRLKPSEMETLRSQRHAVFPPSHVSERITAQIAWFTVHKDFEKPDECEPLDRSAQFRRRVRYIYVPARRFAHLRYHLAVCGVNHASVFPGLDGLCQQIKHSQIYLSDEGPESRL